jgi:hypothetical protein
MTDYGWSGLPAHDHVRLDHFSRSFEVGTRLVHVKSNGMNFVASRLRQTVPGDAARIRGTVRRQP